MDQSPTPPSRRPWALLLLLLLGALFVIALLLLRRPSNHNAPLANVLPLLGTVPAFSLIDAGGSNITLDSLKGKIWVADFIFTKCEGTCPIMTSSMYQLNQELGGSAGVQLVSISVDPAHDTPQALREYADMYQLSRDHWYFLTGDRSAIYALAKNGFHLFVSDSGDTERIITHSSKLALVDGAGAIRGYYEGTDSTVVPELMRDITIVAASTR